MNAVAPALTPVTQNRIEAGQRAPRLIIDKASGVYLDPAKVRASDYDGPFFKTKGPVNAMRPPQGHLVLVSDGAAPLAVPGIDIALIGEGQTVPAAKALAKVGRDADLAALTARFAEGAIDGAHFILSDPVAELAEMAQRFAPLRVTRGTGTLRERLGLPLPTEALTPDLGSTLENA